MRNNKSIKITSFFLAIFIAISIITITASFTKDFVVNNETEVMLDIETDSFYNGTLSITVAEGIGINATVNSETKEILLDETIVFEINNTQQIYFEITAIAYVEGFFVLDLNIDINAGDRNPLTITVGILAAFLVILTFVSYIIRSNRLKTKSEEEDEELMDPEVARKRKEAAGAEKKFWGLDDKK